MRIGEMAQQAGVGPSKIRFYEARGLLAPAPRSANGYRDYGERDVQVVAFITRAQGLGFTLREIGRHLDSPEGDGRKARLALRLKAKLAEIEAHLADVVARRDTLAALIGELDDASAPHLADARDDLADALA